MSATRAMNELVAFEGAVECAAGSGAIDLILRGRERGGGTALTALFAGSSDLKALTGLPAKLHDVRLFDRAAVSGARELQLQAREQQLDLVCRSLQLHRDAGRPFFTAVPPVRPPAATRLGWAVLLSILRIPGAARLLAALRGRR
jgi:hypothetical protein